MGNHIFQETKPVLADHLYSHFYQQTSQGNPCSAPVRLGHFSIRIYLSLYSSEEKTNLKYVLAEISQKGH